MAFKDSKVHALARCTWVSSLRPAPSRQTNRPAHTIALWPSNDSERLCAKTESRRKPKRAVPRLWCLLAAKPRESLLSDIF